MTDAAKLDKDFKKLFDMKPKKQPAVAFLEQPTWAIVTGVAQEVYERHTYALWVTGIAAVELAVIVAMLLV